MAAKRPGAEQVFRPLKRRTQWACCSDCQLRGTRHAQRRRIPTVVYIFSYIIGSHISRRNPNPNMKKLIYISGEWYARKQVHYT